MAFPSWPPPNGGAPFSGTELGPITNPFPYGSTQGSNISISSPAPLTKATYFPQTGGTALNGQNQKQTFPAWPTSKFTTLPDKASPSISQLP